MYKLYEFFLYFMIFLRVVVEKSTKNAIHYTSIQALDDMLFSVFGIPIILYAIK